MHIISNNIAPQLGVKTYIEIELWKVDSNDATKTDDSKIKATKNQTKNQTTKAIKTAKELRSFVENLGRSVRLITGLENHNRKTGLQSELSGCKINWKSLVWTGINRTLTSQKILTEKQIRKINPNRAIRYQKYVRFVRVCVWENMCVYVMGDPIAQNILLVEKYAAERW